jgi:hypothetical protein
VQVGLLDDTHLPVTGGAQARKVMEGSAGEYPAEG